MFSNSLQGMVMIFSKALGSRASKIPPEIRSVVFRAIVDSAVALCASGIHSQVAVRLLIYRRNDAAEIVTTARLQDADPKYQALKFGASNFVNIEAQLLATGQKSTSAAAETGAIAAWNPLDVATAILAAIVAPTAQIGPH
jgi:hypothetical protein